ncbi:MAG: HNH endonuclease [Deltaproteobacteria bacterium]|nr:HNH endonuclease [Deltaproteobacteria bacterium]
MIDEKTLLLDAGYSPISIISWTRAIGLMWLGKVEVLEEYDREVHSPSIAVRLPAVVRLISRIVRPRRRIRFSRQNIFLRDNGKCQYCRRKVTLAECTFDHVIPRVKGGRTCWTNVVLACTTCNRKKGAQTPQAAGLRLYKKPKIPSHIPYVVFKLHQLGHVPTQWRDHLASLEYWTATLASS